MVFERTMKRVADYSVNLFGLLDEDLPPSMLKVIRFILYSAMPFFLNIAYFGLLVSGFWYIENEYGIERVIVILTAFMVFISASQSSAKEE